MATNQYSDLDWILAITQFLSTFQLVHLSAVSVSMLLPWTLGYHTVHLQHQHSDNKSEIMYVVHSEVNARFINSKIALSQHYV
jgi:hypothetical protein